MLNEKTNLSPTKKKGKSEKKRVVVEDPYKKCATLKVLVIYSIVLIAPAMGLCWRAYVDSDTCSANLNECNGKCKRVYAEVAPTMKFMSEGADERACYRKCQSENDVCMRSVHVLLMGAGFLGGSFFCSVGLVQLMLFLKSQKTIGSMDDLSRRPRPITQEPTFTEDELLEQDQKNLEQCRKSIRWGTVICVGCKNAVRSMLMLICQYYGFAPTPDPPWSKTQVTCMNCVICGTMNCALNANCEGCGKGVEKPEAKKICRNVFEVDDRWLTHERSGMKGATCPKCYGRVLGILCH